MAPPIASKDLLLNSHPVTLIDVDRLTVQQTAILNKHCATRREFLKFDLSLLLQGEDAPIYPVVDLFEDATEISHMAQHFISEVFGIPAKCSLRQAYIENFKSLLKHKAKALLTYVEAKSTRGRERIDSGQLLQLRQDLGLVCEADFRMVLAAAEKTRRGLCTFLLGDPHKREMENKGSDVSYHYSMMR